MFNRYVITGIGVITPAGCTYESLCSSVQSGTLFLKEHTLPGQETRPQRIGLIAPEHLPGGLSPRQKKKLDRFTVFSLLAAREALLKSKCKIDETTRDRIGIIIGNSLGGWSYVEPQMYGLCRGNMDAINSYVATAWFPTAAQGEISILTGIRGFSKTISAEKNSGGLALEFAIDVMEAGYLDAVLAGGFEAPLTPLVYNAFSRAGCLSPTNRFQPFHREADGTLLGEGGGFLFVEKLRSAERRNADIYGEILSIGNGMSIQESMRECIERGGAEKVDYLMLEAAADPEKDEQEYKAIADIFSNTDAPSMSAPKTLFGNLLAGTVTVDIAIACGCLAGQYFPPTFSSTPNRLYPKTGRHVFSRSVPGKLENALINSRDNYGQCLSILIGKYGV